MCECPSPRLLLSGGEVSVIIQSEACSGEANEINTLEHVQVHPPQTPYPTPLLTPRGNQTSGERQLDCRPAAKNMPDLSPSITSTPAPPTSLGLNSETAQPVLRQPVSGPPESRVQTPGVIDMQAGLPTVSNKTMTGEFRTLALHTRQFFLSANRK